MLSPTHWFKKIVASILVAFVVVNLLMLGLELLPQKLVNTINQQLLETIILALIGIGFITAIVYSILWHKKEKKLQTDYSNRFTKIIGFVRYWLAFEIATYGFAKVFGTQFSHSFIRDHTLLKEASGFDLTWFYFGYSHPLTIIVAVLQIGGSILLLFRRTTLLACLILLPVMTNILLINLFYDIAAGAFINSVMFNIGLVFILSFYWQSLKSILLSSLTAATQTIGFWFRNILRVLIIGSSAGIILYFSKNMSANGLLKGVWNVSNVIINNDTLNANNWQKDSLVWNKIYFDYNNTIALNGNPYYFEKSKALWGKYEFDEKKLELTATVWGKNKQDTLYLELKKLNDTAYFASGSFKKDSICFQMHKQALNK